MWWRYLKLRTTSAAIAAVISVLAHVPARAEAQGSDLRSDWLRRHAAPIWALEPGEFRRLDPDAPLKALKP